ncbi:hypothetical protein UCD39_10935 [Nitrospirillum sp. BR 11752]|uniref:hypothetical protein n=1 Tax=Nitrospirillum sp. BR 11752 TaxID=3104293 RepID=UPI002EA7E0C0|nr:hypothetical protein [Nitrospirillum sp. BR 11752]
MKYRRPLAMVAAIVDGVAEALAATLPPPLARRMGVSMSRLHLGPGASGPAGPGPASAPPGPVVLVLDPRDVYTVDLPLPPGFGVDPWRQAAMLAHRYMPLKPELLAWDLVTLRQGGQSIARVSMVRRSVLAAALQVNERAVAVTAEGSGPQPQFLRLDGRRLRRRLSRMAGVLAVMALVLPVPPLLVAWTLDQQTAHMERKLKALSDDVKAARSARDRLVVLTDVLRRSGAALTQPSRRQLLDEVAYALPDDALLKDLILGPNGLDLQIQAADPDAILKRFQAAPFFTDVRYVAAPEPGRGTFRLALSIAAGGGPASTSPGKGDGEGP